MNEKEAILLYYYRRQKRLDSRGVRMDKYANEQNWVTIRGVHVLLDKDGNVINNFKDPQHKLSNLRFVDAVSSHSEGGKKVVDAPLDRQTHEQKFNDSMKKIAVSFSGNKNVEAAKKKIANALAGLEQGAVIESGDVTALKMGKGKFKIQGKKGDFTAQQVADRMNISVNDFSGVTKGFPKVKEGTNGNSIKKGKDRISHTATNALEDLYNKFKSNKYSMVGLRKMARGLAESLPTGSKVETAGFSFEKKKNGWNIEDKESGESHKVSDVAFSEILLNDMKTGYAGGTLKAEIPDGASAATKEKIEKAAEKVEAAKPEKKIEKAEKPPVDVKKTEEPAKIAAEAPKESYIGHKTDKQKFGEAIAAKVDSSKYTPEKKEKAKNNYEKLGSAEEAKKYDDEHKDEIKSWFDSSDEHTKGTIIYYTGSGYKKMNRALRDCDLSDEETKKKVESLTKAVSDHVITEPQMVRRGVKLDTFATMFGVSEKEMLELSKNPEELIGFLNGTVGTENGFASCGVGPNAGFKNRQFDLQIYCPEGTEMLYVNPVSTCSGPEEQEVLMQRGTSMRVTGVEEIGDFKYGSPGEKQYRIICEVVAQKQMLNNLGEEVSKEAIAA